MGVILRKGGRTVAKTEDGKKIVYVKPYVRKTDSGKVSVPGHYRSTPN